MAKGKAKIQSVEPMVADLVNGWLKSYGLDYKLEQETLNSEIDKALLEYASKNGGTGGNRPDVKLLLKDKHTDKWPVLIEYKGYKDNKENEPFTLLNLLKSIVNGILLLLSTAFRPIGDIVDAVVDNSIYKEPTYVYIYKYKDDEKNDW